MAPTHRLELRSSRTQYPDGRHRPGTMPFPIPLRLTVFPSVSGKPMYHAAPQLRAARVWASTLGGHVDPVGPKTVPMWLLAAQVLASPLSPCR